jgi:hypothetical protein
LVYQGHDDPIRMSFHAIKVLLLPALTPRGEGLEIKNFVLKIPYNKKSYHVNL